MADNPIEIDARDLLCPLPVLRLRRVLNGAPEAAEVVLLATDAAAILDVPHFCAEAGHKFLGSRDLGDGAREYRVRRGPGAGRTAQA
ncbi:sulfurtransferase TusA family protein [Paracoccus suum]|uniref:Sulfurtransferase TusA family protein n=1 Tax=Paracoccus suum TaxID=2259340 RepID=A0A344PI48_9RHOB|nr:sulfurtransferase TusA family protein [Paracoccus suum]AXC49053.1 sulfurtransferase TusA family protein [Paracoccus suum]